MSVPKIWLTAIYSISKTVYYPAILLYHKMKQFIIICIAAIKFAHGYAQNEFTMNTNKQTDNLPIIGILIFDGFLTNEAVAPLDVFSKKDSTGKKLFNVVLIAKENRPYTSEDGLRVLPDFDFENCPSLKVLVVPSSMNPDHQVNDRQLVAFVKKISDSTDYTASHCAGAFILGASGVAAGKKMVTYCGGAEALQMNYPSLLVQDDTTTATMRDGRIFSSNGNLVSYISSLELLEELTSIEHRQHVEAELLIHKLK